MSYYANLPGYDYPRNALLDFGPIGKTVDAYNKRQRSQAIGNRLLAGGYEAGAGEAYRQGDLEQGIGIGRLGIQDRKDELDRQYKYDILDEQRRHRVSQEVMQRERLDAERPVRRSQAALHEAHAGAYRGMEEERRARARLLGEPADASVPRFLRRIERASSSPESWEAEQPMLQAAFGQGRPIPYDQRHIVLAQAREAGRNLATGDTFQPTPDEMEAGITREHKIRAFRQRQIEDLHGIGKSPEKLLTKGLRLRADGTLERIPGNETAAERKGKVVAENALSLIDEAIPVLVGKIDPEGNPVPGTSGKSGPIKQLVGDEWKLPGGYSVGGFGDAGQAFLAVRAAVIDLNFYLSGMTVSNAEREAFLKIYAPTSLDSQRRQAWKLHRIKSFFGGVMRAKSDGASDEVIADMYRHALKQKPPDDESGSKGGSRQAPSPTPARPASPLERQYGLEP